MGRKPKWSAAMCAAYGVLGSVFVEYLCAATVTTANFQVTAESAQFAREVAEKAEEYRKELAQAWLEKEFPRWSRPCPIHVSVGEGLPSRGVTSFQFDRGEVFGWNMRIDGSRERLLDSVLPHEVNHTVFATHFRRPLPRWLDEGAATTVEHPIEASKHERLLVRFLQGGRGISFNEMFARMDYPGDMLPLYAQGYSITRYLVEQRGRRHFVHYVEAGLESNDWPRATREFYGHASLGALQVAWLDWVRQGSPNLVAQSRKDEPPAELSLVSGPRRPRPEANLLYRVARQTTEAVVTPPRPLDEEQLVPVPRRGSYHQAASGEGPVAGPLPQECVDGRTRSHGAPSTHPDHTAQQEPKVLLKWRKQSAASAEQETSPREVAGSLPASLQQLEESRLQDMALLR